MGRKPRATVRFLSFLLLVCLSLALFFYYLFWQHHLLGGAIAFCLLVIGIQFLALEKKFKIWIKMWTILLIIGGLTRLLMPAQQWQMVLALWLALLTLGVLLWYLKSYLANVRQIVWIRYFTAAGFVVAMMTTVIFGLMLIGMHNRFPFSCEQISSWSQSLMSSTGTWPTTSQPLWAQHATLASSLSSQNTFQSAATTLWHNLKGNILIGLLDTQKTISQQVCTVILDQLAKIYKNPLFQVGAIFAIYLLFYGLIRIVVWVIMLLGYVLFRILKLCGLYQVRQYAAPVDEVL